MQTGSCLCGAVRFRVDGMLREVIYCHCDQCRRQTGHFVAATRCEDVALTVDGGDAITWFDASPEARRGFCARCGSHLFWKRHGTDGTSIWAGAFDKPTGLKASHHIHVASKGDYYDLCDGLPQYEKSDM